MTPFEPNDAPFIFFIGFNKCGTTSFHRLLENSGIKSIHWRLGPKRNLARAVMSNIAQGRRPMWQYEYSTGFSDLTFSDETVYLEICRLFRDLHRAYPGAYFVLNTRDEDGWIRSRLAHQKGRILDHVMGATKLTEDEVVEGWRSVFRTHHAEADAYFADNPRYMRFDIGTDDIEDFAKLVAPHHTINTDAWRKTNRNKTLEAGKVAS